MSWVNWFTVISLRTICLELQVYEVFVSVRGVMSRLRGAMGEVVYNDKSTNNLFEITSLRSLRRLYVASRGECAVSWVNWVARVLKASVL